MPLKVLAPSLAAASLPGLRLVERDQLGERLRGHRWIDRDHHRRLGDHRHRHEVLRRVVGKALKVTGFETIAAVVA